MGLGDTAKKAIELVNGNRQKDYGNPIDCTGLECALFNVFFRDILKRPMEVYEYPMIDILKKMARTKGNPFKEDNYVDIIGYTTIISDSLLPKENED